MKLFLKGAKCFTEKCPVEKRNFAPGQHGRDRKAKVVGYGLQLREKRLRREGHQLRSLLQETAADTEALELLTQVGRDNAAALLRLQQTLTARTIGRATDPWGRS